MSTAKTLGQHVSLRSARQRRNLPSAMAKRWAAGPGSPPLERSNNVADKAPGTDQPTENRDGLAAVAILVVTIALIIFVIVALL